MILCTSFSLQGKSHIKSGTPCQDASMTAGIIGDWTVIISADGVGSCPKSDIGSKTAVETAVQVCKDCFPPDGDEEGLLALLRTAFNAAYNKICRIAAENKDDVFEYETTLDVAIFNGADKVYYGHSGDGGIFVLNGDREYHEITKVQEGEEANSVSPLFSGNKVWEFGVYEDYKIATVACFTDGIRDKLSPQMLENQKYTVNVPMANRFMYIDAYGMKEEEAREAVKKKLGQTVKYLKSSQCPIVDDVTVALAVNTDVFIEEPPYEAPNYLEIEKKELDDLFPTMSKIDKRKLFLNYITGKREALGIEENQITALLDDYYPISGHEKEEWEKKYGAKPAEETKPSPEPPAEPKQDKKESSFIDDIKGIFGRRSQSPNGEPSNNAPEEPVKSTPEETQKSVPEEPVQAAAPEKETIEETTVPSVSAPEPEPVPEELPAKETISSELTPEEKRSHTSPEELDIPVSSEEVHRSESMHKSDVEYSYMLSQDSRKDGQIIKESYEVSITKLTDDAPEKEKDRKPPKKTSRTIDIS